MNGFGKQGFSAWLLKQYILENVFVPRQPLEMPKVAAAE
jgi:hypothetical protein